MFIKKSTIFASLFALGVVGAASAQVHHDPSLFAANNTAAIDISTASTTQLIAGQANARIFITSWDVAAPSGTFKLVAGSGSNCASSQRELTGPYTMNGSQFGKGVGIAAVIILNVGESICATTSANVQYSGGYTFSQF